MTINQIFFAVKTWTNNHEDRVPVIQRTWAKDTKHIRYYSDVAGNSYHLDIHIIIIGPKAWHFFCSPSSAESKHEKSVTSTITWFKNVQFYFIPNAKIHTDPVIPTISTNIENTEHGHCAKTLVILQKVWEEILANEQLKQIKYVVLCDDDTLFR